MRYKPLTVAMIREFLGIQPTKKEKFDKPPVHNEYEVEIDPRHWETLKRINQDSVARHGPLRILMPVRTNPEILADRMVFTVRNHDVETERLTYLVVKPRIVKPDVGMQFAKT